MMNTTTASSEWRSLIDFFNHGTLPFVARKGELERLAGFRRGAAEAQELRAALVIGEAGVGKSRLLDELLPGVAESGDVVVHAKLYPGSSTSIAPILARAIRFSGASKALLKKEPDDDIESVITALQRLARLRPVLLVVEDFHILSGEALAEFAILLEALAGEGIAVLVVARPMELAARGVLERYVVEEIELAGLEEPELGTLWTELFHTDADPAVIALLAELTLGNTLALRSALRGVLKSGALARDAAGIWRPSVSMTQFGEALDRNIRLLSEGMAAHLTDEERRAAETLATVGEVFAREAGLVMIAPNQHLVDVLLFKGILVEASSSILPLPGGTHARAPLAFTHTLLHKHMVANAPVDTDGLVAIIARGLPLYSILPWELVGTHAGEIGLGRDDLRAWIDRSIARANALDGTPDWELAREIIRTVEIVFEAHVELWNDEQDGIRADILIAKLELNKRVDHTPEFLADVSRLLHITGGGDPATRPDQRFLAFKFDVLANWRGDYAHCLEVWGQSEALLAEHPELRFTGSYVDFLQAMASAAWAIPDEDLLRKIEDCLATILASDRVGEDLKDRAWRSIAQYFLVLYKTRAELEKRIRLVADLERALGTHDIMLQTLKVPMFESIGMPNEIRSTIGLLAPRLRERGLLRPYYQCAIVDVCQDAWFAGDIGTIVAAATRVRDDVPVALRARFDLSAGFRLLRFALLRGEYAESAAIMSSFIADRADLAPHVNVMFGAGENTLRATLEEFVDDDCPYPDILAMARVISVADDDARAAGLREVRAVFANPILSIEDLMGMACLLDMLAEAATDPANAAFVDELRGDAGHVLNQAFEWMAERGFFGVLEPMLERHGGNISDRERSHWRGRALESRTAFESRERSRALDTRVRVTMLGTIEVVRKGEEPARPRGARLRTVLGLMVANRMLEKPLSYREFCQVAAGGEEDPERARKMVSMAVLRLQESTGLDILRTAGETPELNTDRVQVDLLDAHRLLHDARQTARRGDLRRALRLLLEALALTRSDVPFPKLYDDFFEALRADFDFTIRNAVIEIGSGLLREGDPVGAEEALERAVEAMPEDEEIVGLLCRALEEQGKRVEAERIRMRIAELV